MPDAHTPHHLSPSSYTYTHHHSPTLDREDLQPDQLFLKRKELLENSTDYEEEKFEGWIAAHAKYRQEDPDDTKLSPEVSSRIGFSAAKDKMREVMLLDTAARLPEVLKSIREELSKCRKEKEVLEGKRKFRDPNFLKRKVGDLLQRACKRVGDYLDGDLEAAVKFPDSLMDLDDELDREEDSEWADRTLGSAATVEDEEKWRDLIQALIDRKEGLPGYVYAEKKYIGGKQFQRAKELMKAAMLGKANLCQAAMFLVLLVSKFFLIFIESFPNVGEMKDYVASGAGYLQGGLQRENST